MKKLACCLALASICAVPAEAGEDVIYTYDALGRIVAVGRSGGPNDGMSISFAYDAAGNRTSHSIVGAPAAPGITCQIAGSRSYSFGGYPIQMFIARKGSCPAGQQVSYQTADGTGPYAAFAGVDYVATSGSVTFPNAFNGNYWSYNEVTFIVYPTQSPSDVKTFAVVLGSINLGTSTQIISGGFGDILPPD